MTDEREIPDHVHVATGHSEHEGDIATGPVYRGERPASDETGTADADK